LAQVSVPFGTTVQPLALRMDAASAVLNGYGLLAAFDGAKGLTGVAGTGPKPWAPAP
jgi:hypothetical protein